MTLSTLVPAPEYDPTAVGILRAQARRDPGAAMGSLETLTIPLTAMHMFGWPRLTGLATCDWRPFKRILGDRYADLGPVTVPADETWSLYGIADLSWEQGGHQLAGLRISVESGADPALPPLRILEFDLNVLQLERVAERRSPRIGYLVPPTWFLPGSVLRLEVLASAEPSYVYEVEMALLGYRSGV